MRVPLTVPAADTPLRKQTLLGMAPPPDALEEKAAHTPSVAPPVPDSLSSIVTPAVVATDAPTTLDVGPSEPTVARPAPTESVAAPALRAEASVSEDFPELKARRPRWLAPVAVAAALGLGVVGLRSLDRPPSSLPPMPKAATERTGAPRPAPAKPESADEDTSSERPEPTAPEPEPSKAAPTPSAAAAAGVIRINVGSNPPGARLFWKGKEVGTTPFALELQPGEKHAYELGLPGYTTRKVVIDSSSTEISVGLRPEPGTFIGAKRRR